MPESNAVCLEAMQYKETGMRGSARALDELMENICADFQLNDVVDSSRAPDQRTEEKNRSEGYNDTGNHEMEDYEDGNQSNDEDDNQDDAEQDSNEDEDGNQEGNASCCENHHARAEAAAGSEMGFRHRQQQQQRTTFQ